MAANGEPGSVNDARPRLFPSSRRGRHRPALAQPRLGDDPQADPVPVGIQGTRRPRDGVPHRRETRECRRADHSQEHRRWPERHAAAAGRRDCAAGRAARCLRTPAPVDNAVHRAARVLLLARHAARSAQDRARGVPSPARAFIALPSRAADRRPHARHRARNARHLDADLVRAVLDPAHTARDRARHRHPVCALRLDLRRHHDRHADRLHRLHDRRHRVADPPSPHDERARLEGEHARGRFADQLRDGQVLRQRGVRGETLRREPAAL